MSSSLHINLPEQRFTEHLSQLLEVVNKAETTKDFTDAYAVIDPALHNGHDFRRLLLDDLMDAYINATWHLKPNDVPLRPALLLLEKQTGKLYLEAELREELRRRRAKQNNDQTRSLMVPQFVRVFGDKPRAELLDVLPHWENTFKAMVDMLESDNTFRARIRGHRMMDRTKTLFNRSFGESLDGILAAKKDARKGPYNKNELNDLWFAAEDAELPARVIKYFRKELGKMDNMMESSAEYNSKIAQLETIIELPWHTSHKQTLTVSQVKDRLDKSHSGLDNVKKPILEQVAIEQRIGRPSGTILCLNGPAGVGKTSLAQAAADAMGRPLVRISLGGKRDVTDIIGHRSTYINAKAGRIIEAVIQAGVKNPVILLDEIDKLAVNSGDQSDIEGALHEVLDPEQNKYFHDSFVDVDFDLSQVTFIATSNNKNQILSSLLDRMEVIEVPSYNAERKYEIARDHLLPKKMKACGISDNDFVLDNGTLEYIIAHYVREPGVRNLERQIEKMCRKIAFDLQTDKHVPLISARNIEDYLGKPKQQTNRLTFGDSVGIVNGLGVWGDTGALMPFEVIKVPTKKGFNIIRTGLMKDAMQESVDVVKSWIRANAEKCGLKQEDLDKIELHVDAVTDGVKDGPSAGAAFLTACMSALLDKPVRTDLAMTGKITLGGRVRAIGGTIEKLEGAMRDGMQYVIIPQDNVKDLKDAASEIEKKLKVIAVKTIDEVLNFALVDGLKALPDISEAKLVKSEGQNPGRQAPIPLLPYTPSTPSTPAGP